MNRQNLGNLRAYTSLAAIPEEIRRNIAHDLPSREQIFRQLSTPASLRVRRPEAASGSLLETMVDIGHALRTWSATPEAQRLRNANDEGYGRPRDIVSRHAMSFPPQLWRLADADAVQLAVLLREGIVQYARETPALAAGIPEAHRKAAPSRAGMERLHEQASQAFRPRATDVPAIPGHLLAARDRLLSLQRFLVRAVPSQDKLALDGALLALDAFVLRLLAASPTGWTADTIETPPAAPHQKDISWWRIPEKRMPRA